MWRRIDPLTHPGWDALLARHPRASVFHTRAWLEALRRTYDYVPVAYTSSPTDVDLQNAVVFCRVKSWLTGRRLVSLPFSDHCEPLLSGAEDVRTFMSSLGQMRDEEGVRYIEIRPQSDFTALPGALPYRTYCFHELDLRPDAEALFRNLQRDSIQRKIRRAEREGLVCETGASQTLIDAFWKLFLLTRRRHRIPPPPRRWCENVLACLGSAAELRVAFHGKHPAAAVITLRCKETMVYKYACSDASLHHLGGMPWLIWKSIQAAKRDDLKVFDFGRSDLQDAGLITFKDRWGGSKSRLTYTRFPARTKPDRTVRSNREQIIKTAVSYLPDTLFASVGSLVYRHIG